MQGYRRTIIVEGIANRRAHWMMRFNDPFYTGMYPFAALETHYVYVDELRYGLNHWEGLVRFLDDGRIELDTNIVERGRRCASISNRRLIH
jgi:Transposase IS66 family